MLLQRYKNDLWLAVRWPVVTGELTIYCACFAELRWVCSQHLAVCWPVIHQKEIDQSDNVYKT